MTPANADRKSVDGEPVNREDGDRNCADLECRGLVRRFGDTAAVDHISLTIPPGQFFSILGPSGCGKTTLLRMLAGFEQPDSGDIYIRDQRMNEVPPNRRPVNMVFQHLALFPTMTVAENIAYGLRRQGVKTAERQQRIKQVLAQVGLPELSDRNPHQLSGGQRQRVALARCLVLEPTLLLLDEPLGALDLKLREQMKIELKHLQKTFGTTFVYITHDQSEALVMSDQVAVMRQGRFDQLASPEELYHNPATPFVASFVGDNNRLPGRVTSVQNGIAAITLANGQSVQGRAAEPGVAAGAAVDLFVRPESMSVKQDHPQQSLTRLSATVSTTLFDGANSRLEMRVGDQTLYARLPQDGRLGAYSAGSVAELSWDPRRAPVFLSGTG
ncbi:ABC transporter ATP-binding protein [Marinobacter caseinilyticus]|uniref:ABC transporter ATP-binding protein n=1 Tax=Marinobacter caseinilyticus TaxID=2692195 RepID=UPI00140D12DB|nr:ABC transporter ATP-binding protein [Marinobacter caseinilyticus]